jgi:hypothetical protein
VLHERVTIQTYLLSFEKCKTVSTKHCPTHSKTAKCQSHSIHKLTFIVSPAAAANIFGIPWLNAKLCTALLLADGLPLAMPLLVLLLTTSRTITGASNSCPAARSYM